MIYQNTLNKKLLTIFMIFVMSFTMFFSNYKEAKALVIADDLLLIGGAVLLIGVGYATYDLFSDSSSNSLDLESMGRSMTQFSGNVLNSLKTAGDVGLSLYNKLSNSISDMVSSGKNTFNLIYTSDEITKLKSIINTKYIGFSSTISNGDSRGYASPIVFKTYKNYRDRSVLYHQMYLPGSKTGSQFATILNSNYNNTYDTDTTNSIDNLVPSSYYNILSGDEEMLTSAGNGYLFRLVGKTGDTKTYNLIRLTNGVETIMNSLVYDINKSPAFYLISNQGNGAGYTSSNGNIYLYYKNNLGQMVSVSDSTFLFESSLGSTSPLYKNGLVDVVTPSSTSTDKTLTFSIPLSNKNLGELTHTSTKANSIPLNTTDGITTVGLTETQTDTGTETGLSVQQLTDTANSSINSLTALFVPSIFPNTFQKILTMNTSPVEPPKVSINLHKLTNASLKFISPDGDNNFNKFEDKETVFIDFSILNKYEFQSFTLLQYIKMIIGFGFVIYTIHHIWRRIVPKETILS